MTTKKNKNVSGKKLAHKQGNKNKTLRTSKNASVSEQTKSKIISKLKPKARVKQKKTIIEENNTLWKGKQFKIFLLIMGVAILLRLFIQFQESTLWWDESIYVGMAKWLFSTGHILGYWESFRPPILPILLGLGWLIKIPIIIWGRILELLFSIGILTTVYYLGEKLYRWAGVFAMAIVAFLPVFFQFGQKILTGIPATFFALVAIIYLQKKKSYWAGIFLGLAFLTRFLFGLESLVVAIAVIIAFIIERAWTSKERIVYYVVLSAKLLGGFLTITLPFFIINQIVHQNFWYAVAEGGRVFTQYNNWIYDLGNIYYFKQFIVQNVFLLFAILGIIFFFTLKYYTKKNKTWQYTALLLPFFIGAYLFHVVHKEVRFMIPVFIFLALFAGIGLAKLTITIGKKISSTTLKNILFVLLLLVVLFAGSKEAVVTTHPDILSGPKYDFYHYFDNQSINDSLFIASSPLFISYTDKPVTMLRSWELAEEVYSRYGNRSDYVAIDTCDKPVEEGSLDVQYKENFLSMMNTRGNVVFNSSYIRWDAQKCDLYIWKLEK